VSIALTGGHLVLDDALVAADLVLDDGNVSSVVPTGSANADATVDCGDVLIAPGFIDLQCNGAGGIDLTSNPDGIVDVGRVLVQFGVTAFLPTVVTSPAATRARAITSMQAVVRRGWRAGDGARALGLHFEGPALSPQHLGAHPARHVSVPDDDEVAAWVDSGAVTLVTVAPEVDGVLAVVARLATGGVVVSAGHTAMTAADLAAARAAGVTSITHLFNAMRPFSHRDPGPIGATLADDAMTVGLICDGIHVDRVAVRMAWNALGPGRVVLVSDAAAPLGAPHGTFALGDGEVVSDETGVRNRTGVLAGSSLELDRAVRNLVAFTGCTLVEAIGTVTATPARLLGLTDRGRIAVGNRADLTLVDHDGHAAATVVGGSLEWASPTWKGDAAWRS
jgi:N-acetylglucosamine-6-phosphate deacetylase